LRGAAEGDGDEVAASGARAELGLNPTNVVARSRGGASGARSAE